MRKALKQRVQRKGARSAQTCFSDPLKLVLHDLKGGGEQDAIEQFRLEIGYIQKRVV